MPKSDKPAVPSQRLRSEDIVHLVGDIDDATMTAILATGASYADVELAILWAGGTDESRAGGGGLPPLAEQVYDILMSDPNFTADEDRPR